MRRARGRAGRGVQQNLYNLRSAPQTHSATDVQQLGVQVGSTDKMAARFESRDDPEYLKFMENEVLKISQSREEDAKLLNSIVSRMDKWESKTTYSGRGILRTPLKADPPQPHGLGRGSPLLS